MNKVIKLGMLFHEGEIPDFGSIQQKTENPNILYLIAEDIPKLNGMLTKTAAESYLPEGSRFGFHTGTLAFVVDHKTAGTGKIYAYHRGRDQWYEFSIRSDLGLFELMRNRHARILREIKEISGTPPLTFKSNGRPLKNYRIYGNTVNGVSVGNLITEGEHAGEYCISVTIGRKAKHTATLQLHDCLPSTMQFDAPEALYYAENGLVAGTYCFTIQNYDTAYGGGKTYHFTLENDVPAGGQLTFDWNYNTQAANAQIRSYANSASITAIERVSVTEGSSGTSLGTTDGTSVNLNHIHRVRYGNNNYGESALRQFLNSSADVGGIWSPKSKFDRPPSWNTNTAGFMKDIDSDFLSALGISHKITVLNTITDGGSSVTLDDKFFLLSRSEVYGGKENNISEGSPYPYYSDYSHLSSAGIGADDNRIKHKNNAARSWWLRSPFSADSNDVRNIGMSGNIDIKGSDIDTGVVPACNIELDEEYKYKGQVLHIKDQVTILKGNESLVFDVIGIDHDDVDFDMITTNIYLPQKITGSHNDADYIDYATQKQYFIDGTFTDVVLPVLPTLSDTNTLYVHTAVQPSKIEIMGRIK